MTTLREAAQAALRIIELRRNLGNAEYDKQAEQAANDLRAVLAVESVRSALAEFDASLTDPALASVHQTAEPAQPVAWRSWTGQCGYGYWESQTDADLHSDPDYRPVPLYTAPPAPADVPVYPNCPHAHECVDGGRYGKGAYEDLMNNAMGGKPWGECLCGIGDDGKPKYQQPPGDVPPMTDEDFVKIAFPYLDGALMEEIEMDGYALLEILRAVEAEVLRRMGVVE